MMAGQEFLQAARKIAAFLVSVHDHVMQTEAAAPHEALRASLDYLRMMGGYSSFRRPQKQDAEIDDKSAHIIRLKPLQAYSKLGREMLIADPRALLNTSEEHDAALREVMQFVGSAQYQGQTNCGKDASADQIDAGVVSAVRRHYRIGPAAAAKPSPVG